MRIHELLALYADGTHDVVDVTSEGVDLHHHLRLPHTVPHQRVGLMDAEGLDVGAGTLVFALLGPSSPGHADPNELTPILRRLQIGARAVLLIGWTIDELPYERLLDQLVDCRCQVVGAAPLDQDSIPGVYSALVVERVDRLAPLRTVLRVVNEHALADLVEPSVRQRLIALERLMAERDSQLLDARRALARLEESATLQVGRAVVHGMRHPVRAAVTVPRDLVRIWRVRRSKKNRRPAPPPKTRVVPIALPSTGPAAGNPRLIVMTAPGHLIVPRRLAQEGLIGYEGESLACWLAATDIAGPGAVLDIGANVGIYAAIASALTKRQVIAFEPTPELVAVARRFAADNNMGYKTESLALGAENGSATLYLSASSDSSNSLAAGFRKATGQIDVQVETLDSYVARTGIAPSVMKVDTESTEPDVLAGAARTITEHRPWILCEVLAGRVEQRLHTVLAPHGYHWYHITSEIPYQEATEIVGDTSYRELMWLFAPQRPGEAFWAALRERKAALADCTIERGTQLQQARRRR